MKVFLVGLPGSGKSTLGRQLAAKLSIQFVDLDEVIEAEEKQPIREIFAQKGEDYFRDLERKSLRKVISLESDFVLATGGGVPCFFDNMSQMNQAGTTVFVDTSVSVIVDRMKQEGVAVRPLLHELDSENFTEAFYQKFAHRIPHYQQAHISVTPSDNLDQLIDQLKLKAQRK
ncbi:MAG: shikimate kinase [Bacteroidota bacterium]